MNGATTNAFQGARGVLQDILGTVGTVFSTRAQASEASRARDAANNAASAERAAILATERIRSDQFKALAIIGAGVVVVALVMRSRKKG